MAKVSNSDVLSQALQNPVLKDFYDRLPAWTDASETKSRQVSSWRRKDNAILHPYLRVNDEIITHAIYDCDYEGALFMAERKGVQIQTIGIATPETGRAHLIYGFPGICLKSASPKSKAFFRDVIWRYGEVLCADRIITGQALLTKNPFHPKWLITTGRITSLSEMAEALPQAVKDYRRANSVGRGIIPFETAVMISPGRNSTLFEYVSRLAYASVKGCESYEQLYYMVYALVKKHNGESIPKYYPKPLPMEEVKSIAKSIAEWTWTHQAEIRNRGVMELPEANGWLPFDEWKERKRLHQQLGAHYTNKNRRVDTEQRINDAIAHCVATKVRPNITLIAQLAGITRDTIYKYYRQAMGKYKIL